MYNKIKSFLHKEGILQRLEECATEEEAIQLLKSEKLWNSKIGIYELQLLKSGYVTYNDDKNIDRSNLDIESLQNVVGGNRGRRSMRGGKTIRLPRRNEHKRKRIDYGYPPRETYYENTIEFVEPAKKRQKLENELPAEFTSIEANSLEEVFTNYPKYPTVSSNLPLENDDVRPIVAPEKQEFLTERPTFTCLDMSLMHNRSIDTVMEDSHNTQPDTTGHKTIWDNDSIINLTKNEDIHNLTESISEIHTDKNPNEIESDEISSNPENSAKALQTFSHDSVQRIAQNLIEESGEYSVTEFSILVNTYSGLIRKSNPELVDVFMDEFNDTLQSELEQTTIDDIPRVQEYCSVLFPKGHPLFKSIDTLFSLHELERNGGDISRENLECFWRLQESARNLDLYDSELFKKLSKSFIEKTVESYISKVLDLEVPISDIYTSFYCSDSDNNDNKSLEIASQITTLLNINECSADLYRLISSQAEGEQFFEALITCNLSTPDIDYLSIKKWKWEDTPFMKKFAELKQQLNEKIDIENEKIIPSEDKQWINYTHLFCPGSIATPNIEDFAEDITTSISQVLELKIPASSVYTTSIDLFLVKKFNDDSNFHKIVNQIETLRNVHEYSNHLLKLTSSHTEGVNFFKTLIDFTQSAHNIDYLTINEKLKWGDTPFMKKLDEIKEQLHIRIKIEYDKIIHSENKDWLESAYLFFLKNNTIYDCIDPTKAIEHAQKIIECINSGKPIPYEYMSVNVIGSLMNKRIKRELNQAIRDFTKK